MPLRCHSHGPSVPAFFKPPPSLWNHLFLRSNFKHASRKKSLSPQNPAVLFYHFKFSLYTWLKAASKIRATVWMLGCPEISKWVCHLVTQPLPESQKAIYHSVARSLMDSQCCWWHTHLMSFPPRLPVMNLCLCMLRLLAHVIKILQIPPCKLVQMLLKDPTHLQTISC